MKKLILIAAGGLFFFFLLIITGALLIAPGSYANAESYIVDIPYKEVRSYLTKFKKDYPSYQYYLLTSDGEEIIHQDDDTYIYMYLKETNQLVSCITLPLDDPNKSRIAIVGVFDTTKNEYSKKINTKDLSKDENKKVKEEFERQVLDKLGKWDHYANGFLRFLGFH